MIEYLNQISAYWADFFGLMIIQNTIFLAIIFVILALLKNNSAQIKYIVSVTGIIKLLLPPFLPFYSSGLVNPMQPLTLSSLAPQSTNAVTGTAGMAAKTLPHTLDIFGVLFIAWTVFALLYLILALGSTFMLYLKLSTAKPVHENVQQKAHLKLLQSNYISTPLSIGLAPKNVFLPSFFKVLPQQCQQVLINHELAHIKRRDGVFELLQILAQAVYFFNPLVWLLNERVNEYREMACDDTAIKQANLSPTEYSRYLVHMAEKMVQPCWAYNSATALIRQKNKLTQRVNYLLKEKIVTQKRKMVSIAALLGILIFSLSWYCTQKTETDAITNPQQKTASDGDVEFVAYDVPPKPIGGFSKIQNNLVYPEIAKKEGYQGKIFLNVLISKEGKVKEVKTVKTLGSESDIEAHPSLRKIIPTPGINQEAADACTEAAITAVKSIDWETAQRDKNPVEVWVALPVVFKLEEGPKYKPKSNYEGAAGPADGRNALMEKLGMLKNGEMVQVKRYSALNCRIDENGQIIEIEPVGETTAENVESYQHHQTNVLEHCS